MSGAFFLFALGPKKLGDCEIFGRIDSLLSKRGVFEAFKVRENEFELFLKRKHLILGETMDYYNAFWGEPSEISFKTRWFVGTEAKIVILFSLSKYKSAVEVALGA